VFNPSEAAHPALARSIRAATDQMPGLSTLGDRVTALFQELRVPVFRFLLRKTHDPWCAEELTQETFLRLFQHLQQEHPIDNPKAWLFTVANNLAIDARRTESHATDVDEITWKRLEKSTANRDSDPENVVLQRERLDRLHASVLNLTPFQRQCLHLRAEGLRYREIAELLDLSVSTVVDAVRRAASKLARNFGPEVSA
jgi:RNA polymerase sigma-70 factor (ECF subfamily)